MNKKKGIISLIVTAALLVLLAFTCFKGFGELGTGATRNITLGLDLAGGVSITYQVKDENPTSEEMSDTIYKLQRRVEQYSTEASVYQEGDDRINIEIPGVTDANTILDELGKPGSLEFQTMDGETVITGSDVETASVQSGQNSTTGATEYSVELDLTEEGTDKFAEATSANVGSQIAIIYDGETISAPTVQQAITGGQAYITGNFTYEEAENLASTIRIGGLQLELEELRSNVVGAQLGEQAISTSLMAGAIGLGLVFLFMCCDPYSARNCRYHPEYRYGGGCQCHHFCTCKRRDDKRQECTKRIESRIPQGDVSYCGWKRDNFDRGSRIVVPWKRKRKRICTDSGNRYCCFHVYSARHYKNDRLRILCGRT